MPQDWIYDSDAWWPKPIVMTRLTFQDPLTDQYVYLHSDGRPWDDQNDLYTYESDFIIRTKTKHKTPMVRYGHYKVLK